MLYNNGLTLVLGMGDVREWNNSNMFECKSYPDVVFHFWRVSGWLTGLTLVRSIKSAWHDSWFSFFPMSSKPNLFKLFWGGVSSTRLGHWIWKNSHLHFLPKCVRFLPFCGTQNMCSVKLSGRLCMRFTRCHLSALMLAERPEGSRLRGLWKRQRVALSPTVSRQCVCHVPHLHRHALQ